MLKSRLIHFVVNLCVIGTLLVPSSGFSTALGADCDQSIGKSAQCDGCGRCSVSIDGESCGCCCKKQKATDVKLKLSRHQSCCSRSGASQVTGNRNTDSSWGICLCGLEPQPTVPAPQGRSTIEQLIRVLLTTTANDTSFAIVGTAGCSIEPGIALPSLSPRDSQRRLCIWLI